MQKRLTKQYPKVTWKVSKEDGNFIVRGSYELAAVMKLPEGLVTMSNVAAYSLLDDVGEAYYQDLKDKVSIFGD